MSPVKIDLHDALRGILAKHTEYHPHAYHFLYLACHRPTGAKKCKNMQQRLSVPNYYHNICEQAKREFGPMAMTVMEHWGIHSVGDIATATLYMVEAGVFLRQREDAWDDFLQLPSLNDMLEKPYQPACRHA